MSVISDIKAFLTLNGISNIKLSAYDNSPSLVCLWIYAGESVDIGQKPSIQILVKDTTMDAAETTITAIYDLLIDKTQFKQQKHKVINGKHMFITANQQPFYLEKDDQQRCTWVFNITVLTDR